MKALPVILMMMFVGFPVWSQTLLKIGCDYKVNGVASKKIKDLKFNPYQEGNQPLVAGEGVNITVSYTRLRTGTPSVTIVAVAHGKLITARGSMETARLTFNDGTDNINVTCGQH